MTRDEKYIKICGGLGNQMFQYAFAKALEKKLENCDVYLDTYWFTLINKSTEQSNASVENFIKRNYELDTQSVFWYRGTSFHFCSNVGNSLRNLFESSLEV